jgi:hypothetical protein
MPVKLRLQWPGDCEPAGLLCVGGRATASRSVFLASADGVAAGRLAIAVCASRKLSRCKRSCDSLACRRSASLYIITRRLPTQWALELPWWAFASLWEAPTSCKIATNFVLTIILKIVQKHVKERGLLMQAVWFPCTSQHDTAMYEANGPRDP